MDKYYLKVAMSDTKNAGSKAVNDCNAILEELGYKPVELELKKAGKNVLARMHNLRQVKQLQDIPKNCVFVVGHPMYMNRGYMKILAEARQKKNVKVVYIVHDLESLRKLFTENADMYVELDQGMYNNCDYIICHNSRMADYIEEQGVDRDKLVELGIFDYLSDRPINKTEYAPILNIAGNLDYRKCGYLSNINEIKGAVRFNLFGMNYDKEVLNSQNINYKGAFPAAKLTGELKCGFGLVWDGSSSDGCQGNTGNYLRYNNPHKLSLYISAGMPVAVWSQSAVAEYVRSRNVGIVLDCIEDFTAVCKALPRQEYDVMAANARAEAEKLRSGCYLKAAVNRIEDKMQLS